MKLEMDDNTSFTISVIATCAAVVAIAFLIYRYNAVAYENGYTQKTLETTSMPVWVRE